MENERHICDKQPLVFRVYYSHEFKKWEVEMARILEEHKCKRIPEGYKILKSEGPNKWVIASSDGDIAFETKAINLRYCPYCREDLSE